MCKWPVIVGGSRWSFILPFVEMLLQRLSVCLCICVILRIVIHFEWTERFLSIVAMSNCVCTIKNGLVHYLIATNKRTTIEKKRVAFICHCTTIVNGDVHLRGNGSREKVDWSLKWWPNHDETAILSCFPFSFSF